ncbi:DNA helicase PIF1, ATP-dependent, partial [Tanacetum coccineum]
TPFQDVTPVGSLAFNSTIVNGTNIINTVGETSAKESPSTEQVRGSSVQSSLLTSEITLTMEILPLNVHLVVHSYGAQKVCEEQLMHVLNPIQCVVVDVRMRFKTESQLSESSSSKNDQLDYKLTTDIHDLLNEINPLVKDFRMAGERIRSSDDKKVSLRLIGTRQRDGRQYNLPTASEVAALIVGDFDSMEHKRDVILQCQDGDFKRIIFCISHPREKNEFSMMLNGRRVFQQFVVDAYTMTESERLSFNRKNDKDMRSENYSKLATLAQNKDSGVKLRGKKVVLNSTFTRSPHYMMQNYLDAMTLHKFYGYPDLFITFTCNPNWPEISRFMAKRGLKSEDRPDVISRVFKIKLDCLMKEIKDDHIFGRVEGGIPPHCHILLWLEAQDKLTTIGKIDKYISSEIPNKDDDPELYQLVTDHMMHGPCGADNPSCPCTVDYKCTKKFPKQFNESTVIDDSGYAIYKRRNYGSTIKKSGTNLHNGYVVPYNPGLLRRYQAHINVKYCNQVGSIKYLFKYINKGPDRVSVTIDGEEVDEIKDYLNCRYLLACDAAWRIYGFDIHYRTLSVERLPFRLKDEQQVIFDVTESINYAVDKSFVNETKFESWMELNKTDPFACSLLYVEIPRHYVWNQKRIIWTLRKQGKSLGRIHHVPTSWGELYYLCTILNKVRGPMEWGDLKKVDDVLYPTYKDACYARGLLQDDKEYIDGILETVMAADMLNVERIKQKKKPGLELSDIQRKNICLTYIECMLWSNNRSLKDIQNMPYPDREYMMDGYNRLIFDETSYDPYKLKEQHVKLYGSLTSEQKDIYSTVMDAVDNDKGGMFFVYGYGSTGKTYLYKTMSVALRSKGEIVLNVASSGIATLLLEGGRTAHSRFAIPINVVED